MRLLSIIFPSFNLYMPHLSRRRLIFLALLGLIMFGLALRLDLHDFYETPAYLWLFVPICSLYPLLLSINYLFLLKKGAIPQFLLAFTLFGIIGYGVMAPVFYTMYMLESGFSWYEFGNIFWVWLYASQAILLWPYIRRVPSWQFGLIGLYFLAKDLLDRFSVTWSYTRFGVLSETLMNRMFCVAIVVHIVVFAVLFKKCYLKLKSE